MALTRDFREMVVDRAERDPVFRREMLESGIELLFTGDPTDAEIGRGKLRDYVNATLGFEELGRRMGVSPKSLMRMLSRSGNPNLASLSALIGELQDAEGVRLEVSAEVR